MRFLHFRSEHAYRNTFSCPLLTSGCRVMLCKVLVVFRFIHFKTVLPNFSCDIECSAHSRLCLIKLCSLLPACCVFVFYLFPRALVLHPGFQMVSLAYPSSFLTSGIIHKNHWPVHHLNNYCPVRMLTVCVPDLYVSDIMCI
jgi:hypothetical protein